MRRVTLDGTLLTMLGLEDHDLLIEEFAWLSAPPEWSVGIQVSDAHVAEFMLTEVMGGRVAESVTLHGGTVFLGDSSPTGALEGTLAGWRGEQYSAYTVVPLGAFDFDRAIRLFSKFQIREGGDGLSLLSPEDARGAFTRRTILVSCDNGVTTIDVKELSPENLATIPDGRGALVPGGELWRATCDGRIAVSLLAPSAVALLSSDDESALLEVAERVQIDWKR
jgi:hypothetical protein